MLTAGGEWLQVSIILLVQRVRCLLLSNDLSKSCCLWERLLGHTFELEVLNKPVSRMRCRVSFSADLILATSITLPAFARRFVNDALERSARVSADGLLGVRVEEGNEEEWNIVLPRYATVGRQVNECEDIVVPIRSVRDKELFGVGRIVYVPSTAASQACERIEWLEHRWKESYKMTLQNPKPSDDAALRNLSLDCAPMSTIPVTADESVP